MLTLNDGRAELWQWDTGRTLAVDADCSQVHFSNKVFGRSIDVDVVDGAAIIPDVLLQTDNDLNVWAFVGTAENGYTKISKTFKVNRRNKPADYVFTPTDQITLQTIQSQIGDLAALTTAAKDNLAAAINEVAAEIPTVDSTLTKSGQAADAAVVGDRLSALSEEIVYHVSVEPEGDDIPKVYFTGTLPSSKAEDDVKLTMHYISKTADFIYPVTLKVQGSSSANYAKKNFTLKLYKDATYESKKKLAFKNWPEMNKFVLKAHWIDHSHVRNVGTAKLGGKVVASRSDYNSLPEELRNSPNNGATDGFTVKVFANGVYQGLYEWIVPKDKLFGQDSNIVTHSILNSELNNQPTCAFATTSPTISGNWSEELQDTMSTAISTSFANLIKFVAGSTDEEFVENAENYFDVQSVIDFDIFARVFCIVDNLCRNQIFFTYDGVKWYEGVWDLDAILGLPPTTRGFFAYNTEFQTGYIAYKDYGVTNLLYQRVETLFMGRFKARYAELRSSVLSIENILDVYERLADVITTYDGLLAEDYASTTGGGAFTGIPYKTENTIQQIRNFVAQRIPYMDEVIADMSQTVPCTGISLNTDTLTFTSEGSQTLIATVTPDGCTDVVTWESNNTSVATVNGGVVTAVTNGNATITARCGDYSATCSVSVSGIAEPVPCTGITLDKTELTFNGEETQTIIATVTPSDTTDTVVWVSSAPAIASITVEGNVCTVQRVSEGSTNVTATCGNYSASCTVTVNTKVNATGILAECTFADEYINTSGVASSSGSDKASSAIHIEDYRGKGIGVSIAYNNAPDPVTGRVCFYDSDMAFISYVSGSSVETTTERVGLTAKVPDNAVYIRISANNETQYGITGITVYGEEEGNNLYTEDTNIGSYYDPEGGALKTYATYNSALITISGDALIKRVNTVSGAVYNENDEFINRIVYKGTGENTTYQLLPPNTAKIGVNRDVSNSTYGIYVGKVIGTVRF